MNKKGIKEEDKINKILRDIVIRYAIIILFSLNIWFFYWFFKPFTIYPLSFLLNLFYSVQVEKSVLIINSFNIEIIEACIAGSAFYALLMLNLLTPGISAMKRIKIFLINAVLLLLLNILRIFFLTIFYINSSASFNILHYFFWFVLSTLFVAGLWIFNIKVFNIKEIPFYSDFKFLKSLRKRVKV